jgi:hypothetical protein
MNPKISYIILHIYIYIYKSKKRRKKEREVEAKNGYNLVALGQKEGQGSLWWQLGWVRSPINITEKLPL